ncbi:MAG: hypothetical protein K0S65_811 [Labilithrix sp.]|nr:hypothetical protein [Labilithrix sp.]
MRHSFILAWAACASSTIAVAAACSASGREDSVTTSEPDSGGAVLLDGATFEDAPDDAVDAGPRTPRCSKAGWCETPLPDEDLDMRDVWPLNGRAFAIAQSPRLNIKVLEWEETGGAGGQWKYIDDGSQNDSENALYPGNIWAPNDNEVYYAAAPGYIYHGTRTAPGGAWTWLRHQLQDNSHAGDPAHAEHDHGAPNTAALGVWGTSQNDVYAWYSNTIYHWTSEDGGTPAWIAEYKANDADDTAEHLYFLSAGGTGPDDLWFAGGRDRYPIGRSCAVLMHKTAQGYERVADGIVEPSLLAGKGCVARDDSQLLSPYRTWMTPGWSHRGTLSDIQTVASGRLVGVAGGVEIIELSGVDGGWAVARSPIPFLNAYIGTASSLWTASDDVWLTVPSPGNAPAMTLRGTDIWDGGQFNISTTALGGAPLWIAMHQIRGTDSTNMWAVGGGYALHKTTP